MRVGASLAAILCAVAPAFADDDLATITGVVVDEAGAPVIAATIVASEGLALSDDEGRFTLEVPTGAYDLVVQAPGMRPGAARAHTGAAPITIVLAHDPDAAEQIEVVDDIAAAGGATALDADAARAVPGSAGDPLKAAQSLPGVARPAPGASELVVWGASPEDTKIFVDDVPLPRLYHLGGWRSTVPGELVTQLTLLPGAFAASHGDALGGVLTVETEVPRGRGAVLAADVLDAGGAAWAERGRLRVAAAARASYLDRAVALVDDRGASEAAALIPIPVWADGQIAAAWPAQGGEARVTVLASSDTLARVVGSPDPAAVRRDDRSRRFARAVAAWRGPAAQGTARVTTYLGVDDERLTQRFGDTPAEASAQTLLVGVRATHTATLGDRAVLTLGLDAEASRSRHARAGSLGTPAREGDVAIFGQPPGDDVAVDTWRAGTLAIAPHATFDLLWGPLTLSPGVRLTADALAASRTLPPIGRAPAIGAQRITVAPEPRLSMRYALSRTAALSVDLGLHRQRRDPADTSAVFGTPTLGHERAVHAAVGGAVAVGPTRLEAVAYGRWLDDLVARDPSPTPPVAAALTQAGSGSVLGAQLVARVPSWRGLAGWISYGLSRSTRRDHPDAATRRFDLDQPHLLTAVVGWQRGRWSLGARARVASGLPRTQVIGSFLDARSGRAQPIVGATNAIRLPAFAQLDARVEVALGRGLRVALELQNLTARANAEEFVYSADYAEVGTLTGLPFLAVVGVRWEAT